MSTYINLTQDFYDKYQMYGNEHSLLHIVRTLNGLLVADPNTINDFPELFEEYYNFIEVDTDFYNKYGGISIELGWTLSLLGEDHEKPSTRRILVLGESLGSICIIASVHLHQDSPPKFSSLYPMLSLRNLQQNRQFVYRYQSLN